MYTLIYESVQGIQKCAKSFWNIKDAKATSIRNKQISLKQKSCTLLRELELQRTGIWSQRRWAESQILHDFFEVTKMRVNVNEKYTCILWRNCSRHYDINSLRSSKDNVTVRIALGLWSEEREPWRFQLKPIKQKNLDMRNIITYTTQRRKI